MKTEYLTAEVIKKHCAFVMHLNEPSDTLRSLALFFKDRKIEIETLHMHRYENGEAQLIIHCNIEKDRITRTVQLLEELPGVMELEMLK